jgi:GT2 family glycosyltransferase
MQIQYRLTAATTLAGPDGPRVPQMNPVLWPSTLGKVTMSGMNPHSTSDTVRVRLAPATPAEATEVRLHVIVPVFGNWADTIDCLRMLAEQESKGFSVILADDGSPDPPPAEVHSFPFVHYIRGQHVGFAANCNAAARLAQTQGATHLLFLNNDTAFSPRFIGEWLRTVRELPDAVLGPLIYWHHDPTSLWFTGGPQSILLPFFRLRQGFRVRTPVDVLCGCVLLVPMTAWMQLDGFHEGFVTYYEDFDFSLRAKRGGIPAYVVVDRDLSVRHKVSRTTSSRGAWSKEYLMITSRLFFIRRNYRGVARCTCLLLCVAHLAVTLVTSLPALPDPGLLWKAVQTGLWSPAGQPDASPGFRR